MSSSSSSSNSLQLTGRKRKRSQNRTSSGRKRLKTLETDSALHPTHVVVENQDNTKTTPIDPVFPIGGQFSNQVYNIVQSYETTSAATSTTNPTFNTFSFALSNLDDSSALGAVFDQYRIKMIEVTAYPGASGSYVQTNNSGGVTHIVIDYDDASALTTVAAALDYQNCMVVPTGNAWKRTFVPHVALAAYSGAFTSFANFEPVWCDFASPSIAHFGLKIANTASLAVISYNLIVRMHIQCRNLR
jgi:hypothetical protein